MSAADKLETRLAEATAAIGTVREMADTGAAVRLDGFEAGVAALCEEIDSLPRPERAALKPALIALIDSLGALAAALERQHARLADTLSDTSARQRAATAYRGRFRPPDKPGGSS